MRLETYIKKTKLPYTKWAKEHKIAPSVLCRLFKGKNIHTTNALRIVKATGGEVTLDDIFKCFQM